MFKLGTYYDLVFRRINTEERLGTRKAVAQDGALVTFADLDGHTMIVNTCSVEFVRATASEDQSGVRPLIEVIDFSKIDVA